MTTDAIHGTAAILLQVVESSGIVLFAALEGPTAVSSPNATAFIPPQGPAAIKAV
jgi:hypothetical protein